MFFQYIPLKTDPFFDICDRKRNIFASFYKKNTELMAFHLYTGKEVLA